jgi:hypothetical protein
MSLIFYFEIRYINFALGGSINDLKNYRFFLENSIILEI